MKKSILAIVLATACSGAYANSFYVDVGYDYGGFDGLGVNGNDNATGAKDEFTFNFVSNSIITDVNGNDVLDVGDTIVSEGGIALSTQAFDTANSDWDPTSSSFILGDNFVSGFNPGDSFGNSNNGFGTVANWGLTFGFSDVVGEWTTSHPDGEGFVYTGGTISFYYYDFDKWVEDNGGGAQGNGSDDLIRLFDLSLEGGFVGNTGQIALNGLVTNVNEVDTVNGVAAGEVMNIMDNSGVWTSFAEMAANGSEFSWVADYTTTDEDGNTIPFTTIIDDINAGFGAGMDMVPILDNLHNGSTTFRVPEPSSLAILGLGLLAAGAARRRKA